MATVHEERIAIRWRDVDNYGHVNNAVYLTYLEEARDAWVREGPPPAVTRCRPGAWAWQDVWPWRSSTRNGYGSAGATWTTTAT